jgi:anti-sigma B factor antagonist
MTLQTEIFDDVIVVHTPEELGADQSDAFENCILSLERRNVVLDLDATETLDSKGLTSLLNVQDKLRDAAGEAKISTNNAANRKIFEITRLDRQLEVFDSVVDAVKSFHS